MPDVRLIDANAMMRDVMGLTIVSPEVMNYANAVGAVVANTPTIDAVPVVHGRWRQAKFTQAPLYICSECDSQAYTSHNYCPNCGARMDGGAEG